MGEDERVGGSEEVAEHGPQVVEGEIEQGVCLGTLLRHGRWTWTAEDGVVLFAKVFYQMP